jgi:hypothetical protein
MTEILRWIAYDSPRAATLGPFWSAIGLGYATRDVDGRIRITETGRLYLQSCA